MYFAYTVIMQYRIKKKILLAAAETDFLTIMMPSSGFTTLKCGLTSTDTFACNSKNTFVVKIDLYSMYHGEYKIQSEGLV